MDNGKTVKILGIVATIVGIGVTLLTDWLDDKKMDEKISQALAKKITEINEKES